MTHIFSELTQDEIKYLKENNLHYTKTLNHTLSTILIEQVYYEHFFSINYFYYSVLDDVIYGREHTMGKLVTSNVLKDVFKAIKTQLVGYIGMNREDIIEKYPEWFL